MATSVWLVLVSALAFVAAQQDKSTDENRPYKFGFNIEGYQHRKEEKDEKGIIKGEYGFITADGYYRITVYATDENGAFHIVSTKNIYVGFPPEDPTTTPAPTRAQGERLNLKFGQQSTAVPTSRSTQSPAVFSTTTTAAGTPSPPLSSTTQFGRGKPACSGCFLPTTTQRPLPQPPKSQPIGTAGLHPTANQPGGQQPGSPFTSQSYKPPALGAAQGGNNNGNRPSSFGAPNGDNRPTPAINQVGQPFVGHNNAKKPTGNLQGQYNPVDINNRLSPGGPTSSRPTPGTNIAQTGQGQNNDNNNNNNVGGNNNRSTPSRGQLGSGGSRLPGEEREGLPPGVSEDDVMALLYRFNYTVGFHGHHEDGYINGDKKGDYFFDGRDGTERRVEYIANEFGYQPNITLIRLEDNDVRIPKEETEKDFGLKGYEFKWFRNP